MDNVILIDVLKGITGTVLKWFELWLYNGMQYTKLDVELFG